MKRKPKRRSESAEGLSLPGYDAILREVAGLLETARRTSARAVNAVLTATYWQIGRRIAEFEMGGGSRATYGDTLVRRLAADLTARFGRGFGRSNLYQMRSFFLAYRETVQAPSGQLPAPEPETIVQTVSGQSAVPTPATLPAQWFPLPWSHYVRLLSVTKPEARRFYEQEALRGGWSIRQLDRQISSQFYERTLMSRNKSGMLRKGQTPRPEDAVSAEEEIKDPLVLEFLGLKDEYSESDLEEALIRHLEGFLLELGGDFAFIGRQRRLRIGNTWYRIDLLFFHRRLRCLVVIDLKTGPFTHADAGQMHLYLNYASEHWTHPSENPPVGLILCAEKDEAVARYALDNLPNKVLAAEYRLQLPDEAILTEELLQTRRAIEARRRR